MSFRKFSICNVKLLSAFIIYVISFISIFLGFLIYQGEIVTLKYQECVIGWKIVIVLENIIDCYLSQEFLLTNLHINISILFHRCIDIF